MRWNSFIRSIMFAAGAAAAYVPYSIVLGPWLSVNLTLSTYMVLMTSVYLAGIASTLRMGLGAALLATFVGAATLALFRSPFETAIASSFVLGICRSGMLFRSRFARAVVIEVTLAIVGLVVARFLMVSIFLPVSLAIWGFFLVQSVFFLIGGIRERNDPTEGLDPFERAHARAIALLENRDW